MGRLINPNLSFLNRSLKFERRSELLKQYEAKIISYENFREICQQEDIPSGAILEGSSRSGKTTASVDFKIKVCARNETGATFNIFRETYNSFKTTLYDDLNKRLTAFGAPNPFDRKQEVTSFKLFGNKINLLGADSTNISKVLGAGCDYLYFNEMLDIPEEIVNQAIQRCRKFWWGDLNPKYADSYVFTKILTRNDVAHIRTTYKDNPFISPNERLAIEGYQPVESSKIAVFFGSDLEDETKKHQAIERARRYDVDKNPDRFPAEDIAELKRCIYNEKTGTADPYMWDVYGMGLRRAPDGIIFPKVTWVKQFPENCEKVYWGLDFGYTMSPSVLVKVGVIGTELYAEIKFYQPTPSSNDLLALLKQHITQEDTVWADPSGDSGGRSMISDCRREGFKVRAANTYRGSIKDGIAILKKYSIHLIDCAPWRTEQSGYRKAKAKVNGSMVTLDDPVDDKNHAWDAARITALMNRL